MEYASRRKRHERRLNPVRPNAGIETKYRQELRALIQEMHDSVLYWMKSAWNKADPATVVAMDEAPVTTLRKALAELRRRWSGRFDEAAKKVAENFASDVAYRTDAALRRALRDKDFSVRFVMTDAMRDVMGSTVQQNVSLIKSIPEKYLGDVEGAVMRSVQTGRDLASLSKALQQSYGVVRRRADLIARDQIQKSTAAFNRVRQLEIGIDQAVWRHSHAGKTPRPTHVKMDGKKYDVAKGMWDNDVGEYIQPGELVNCRCYSVPVLPGF